MKTITGLLLIDSLITLDGRGFLNALSHLIMPAMTLGIVESITATFFGPSWAPAVAFTVLLVTLSVRPAGILGR